MLALLLLAAISTAHAEVAAPVAALPKKALLIGIDGLRSDALSPQRTPHLARLMREGAWTDDAYTGAVTVSGPGWSSVLCGVWADRHGVVDNTFAAANYAHNPHWFAIVRAAAPTLRLGHWSGWEPLDATILGATKVDDRLATTCDAAGDQASTERALQAITQGSLDAAFLYFAELDETGHRHGFHVTVPEYVRELARTDAHIGRVLEAVRLRQSLEDWLVVVVTDHGGTIDGNHGRDIEEHRRIPLVVWGTSARRGRILDTAAQVDVLPTLLAHLQVEPSTYRDLDGWPLGLARGTHWQTNLVRNGDAEQGEGRATPTPDRTIPCWRDFGSATVMRYPTPVRGRQYFGGGASKLARMEQVIAFDDAAEAVDRGLVQAQLSAWLGGCADQRDLAWIELWWLDAHGRPTATHGPDAELAPVSVSERRAAFGGEPAQWSGFLRRELHAPVPAGTRGVRLIARFEGAQGDNDAAIDDVSLLLTKR